MSPSVSTIMVSSGVTAQSSSARRNSGIISYSVAMTVLRCFEDGRTPNGPGPGAFELASQCEQKPVAAARGAKLDPNRQAERGAGQRWRPVERDAHRRSAAGIEDRRERRMAPEAVEEGV